MKKRKICIIIASRANYARIKSVLPAILEHPDLDLQLIVSASALLDRYGRVADIVKSDGFKINVESYVILEGETPATMVKSTGLAMIELATIFENLKPDFVVTVADRYETLATAVAASYMNIPVAHVQGGEVTGSIDEGVRHAVTKLSHIHFPSTEEAGKNIISMGENADMVFVTGCPSMDLLKDLDPITQAVIEKYGGTGTCPDITKPYLLVMQHPVTTEYGNELDQIKETIKAVNELNIQTIWLWPNVDAGSEGIAKGLRLYREHSVQNNVGFYKNFEPKDYASILKYAGCIVGNSSSGIREGAFLGTPCINIGTRQTGRERGNNVIDVDYNAKQILQKIKDQLAHGPYEPDYRFGKGAAGKQIAEILATQEVSIQKKFHK